MNGSLPTEALLQALSALLEQGDFLVADEWLTLRDAMTEAGITRTRLYEWMSEGLPFRDECPRRIRRSALTQFMREREVVIVRGKKTPALCANRTASRQSSTAPGTRRKQPPRVAAEETANVARISGPTDRASLLALLDQSRAAA